MNHRTRKVANQEKNAKRLEGFLWSLKEAVTKHEKDLDLVMAHCFRRDISRHYREHL